MYVSYWLHRTGQLLRSSSPALNPTEEGWEQVGEGEFKRLMKVADFAMHGWYDIEAKPRLEWPFEPWLTGPEDLY